MNQSINQGVYQSVVYQSVESLFLNVAVLALINERPDFRIFLD